MKRMKIVIADPKKGKSYQTEVEEAKSRVFYGMKIGEEVDGSLIGVGEYKLKITGGTDSEGFPMRGDVHGIERKRILISAGAGIRKKQKGEKKKKTVRGNTISESIVQINMVVTSAGSKPLAEVLGIVEKEPEKKEEPKKEEKPKEERKEEVKKVEEVQASAAS